MKCKKKKTEEVQKCKTFALWLMTMVKTQTKYLKEARPESQPLLRKKYRNVDAKKVHDEKQHRLSCPHSERSMSTTHSKRLLETTKRERATTERGTAATLESRPKPDLSNENEQQAEEASSTGAKDAKEEAIDTV